MSNSQNEENMQVTGKQLERLLYAVLGTGLGFWTTKLLIIPEIGFFQFLFTELVIMILFGLSQQITNRK